MLAPLVVPILLGVTAAIAAGGAAYGGVQAKQQADTQAKVYKQQANYALLSAAENEAEYRRRQDRLMATRRALLGATGVEGTTGSPLLATEDFASEAELQALKIRQGGKVEATRLEQQASLLSQAGSAAQTSGFIKGGASLLSGGSDAYTAWKNP
jgi:hypothetical protein